MGALALASSADGGAVPAAPRNLRLPPARSSPHFRDDGVRAGRSSRLASSSALARTSASSRAFGSREPTRPPPPLALSHSASSDRERLTGSLMNQTMRLGGASSNDGENEPNSAEYEQNDDCDDERSDSENAGDLNEAALYTKRWHVPGDGKRSTEEAWREYLNREEVFSVYGGTRAAGFRKLVLAADPDSGGTGEHDKRWGDVRRFLQEASDEEKKEAAIETDIGSMNSLHLVCGARPPKDIAADIIQLLIDRGGTDLLKEKDPNGRLPIHLACYSGASEEVVRLLIDGGGTDTLREEDEEGWLPIHLACYFGASEDVTCLLIDREGSDTLKKPNKFGWLPIRYACHRGASKEVIRLLIDRGGSETLKVADIEYGGLPIHFACYNGASEEVVRLLIDRGGIETLKEGDKDGWLPLYFALKYEASEGIIRLLIDRGGDDDWKAAEIRHLLFVCLTDAKRKQRRVCLRHRKVKEALNHHFTARPILAVMMMDLYMQVLLITVFSIASSHSIGNDGGIETWQFNVLVACLLWFGIRELMQLLTLRAYRCYLTDVWNLVDWSQIALVSVSVAAMNSGAPISANDSIRTVLTVTIGIVWLSLLGVIKHFLYGIAIFLASLHRILARLVPFIVVAAVTTAAYIFMLHTANSNADYCDESKWYCGTLGQLFVDLSAFVLSVSEVKIGREIVQDSATTTVVLYFFGFMIAVIFLNILIAKISNIFSATEAEGDSYFWENRLSVVAEVDSIRHILRINCSGNRPGKPTSPSVQGSLWALLKRCIFFADDWDWDDTVDLMFEQSVSKLKFFHTNIWTLLRRVLIPMMLLCFFVLGLGSFGILWPKSMAKFMFFGKIIEKPDNFAQKCLSSLKQELSSIEERIEQKISAMEEVIKQNNEKISSTEERMEQKMSAMKEIVKQNNEKISAIEERIKECMEDTSQTIDLILKQLEEMSKRSFLAEI